jgi:integrase
MSVRKRTWKTKAGETKECWIVDYRDRAKNRVMRTFSLKKEAEDFATTMKSEIRDGIHIARSKSITVAQAGKFWIDTAEANELERATVADYKRLVDMHIVPFIGSTKLSDLSVPMVRAFEDKLLKEGRSSAMVKRVRCALSMLLSDAMERGLVARNVVRGLTSNRKRGKERQAEKRQKGKLKVGVHIPEPDEIRIIMAHLKGRWRPLLLTAMFCGLRSSELRGLRWQDVDLAKGEVHVRQRADRYNKIGNPKSEDGERTVPLLPLVLNALKAWKLECPKGDLELAFPNLKGNIESHANIITRGLWPVQLAAGVSKVVMDGDGKPVTQAKYTGMHALRHFYASWCINRKKDGGLELPAKVVQERLGHSSIVMTLDVYGHLFPKADDRAELEAAEKAFLSCGTGAA